MGTSTRRKFMQSSAAGLMAAATLSQRTRAATASEKVRIGVIGCGNQGKAHVASLLTLPDAEIAYLCDVDESRLAERAAQAGGNPQLVSDLRRVLDDKTVDGVTIATPDHWHTPAALLALDAGKHVYVEKPCSHNVREGQMLVDASRRLDKVVAHGTQARSSPGFQEAMALIEDGVIGDVLIAKCWNWQRRKNIGHGSPSDPPAGVDYETWVGPAEWMPFQANRFHYDWHWWYNFGCGGMGNDGVHELDYALWGLGVDTLPDKIVAGGGKYHFDDDQQFPDTQQVTLEWTGDNVGDSRMLIYEQRLWSTTYPYNVDAGAEYYGTNGKMFISKRGKFQIWGDRNRRGDQKLAHGTKSVVAENQQNWIDCFKSGETPNASVDKAHLTASAIHMGNIATRLGRALQFDRQNGNVVGDDEANAMLGRKYREGGHWGIPEMA